MNLLYLATKPPWPPVDGGRLLVARTLEGLAAAGHRVVLVAPRLGADAETVSAAEAALGRWCEPRLVAARPRSLAAAALVAALGGAPLTIARHALAALRRAVGEALAREPFDLVHVEQLQALAQAEPAFAGGVPVVLRAQNVESDLWARTADLRPFGVLARREARRLARLEGRAVARVAATVALTAEDARRLGELAAGAGRVSVVRVPFPALLEPASEPLPGAPAVVVLGSGGWLPNRDGLDWFLAAAWPAIRRALPAARLHLFGVGSEVGATGEGVEGRPAPASSRDAFAPGSVLAVPLRIASGVRMKILEAWARGVPVVATPAAAAGLDAEDGRELLVAADGDAFAAALRRLVAEPALAAALVAAGRAKLRASHDPAAVARDLAAVYSAL